MTVVLPGDILSPQSSASTSSQPPLPVKLGPGLLPTSSSSKSSSLTATRAGVLGHIPPKGKGKNKAEGWWVETNSKRYFPSLGDSVIGQVLNTGKDSYTLSLGSSHPASLPNLSFEGATKRHHPQMDIGSLVYARVTLADKHTEPEVSCVDPETGKGEGFGPLRLNEREQGFTMLFEMSLGLARSLLRPTHPLLPLLSTFFPFEAAIGMNGLIWVRASSVSHIIAFGKIIQEADRVSSFQATSGQRSKNDDVDIKMEEESSEEESSEEEVEENGIEKKKGEEMVRKRGVLDQKIVKSILAPYL